ncbi:MAG: hypothetical protein AB8G99_21740 [Planctomycetaceae bacterium]
MIQRATGRVKKTTQPEMIGVGLSIASHLMLVLLLSLIVFRDDAVSRFETEVSISDALPTGVTATLEDDAVLLAEAEPVDLTDTGSATDFISPDDPLLMPQGLANADVGAKVGAATAERILTGVDAAVADIQERVERAGGKTGEVQFSLSWHDRNDVDLHVITPNGDRIHFHRRKSSSGGELDVDMNVEPENDRPVENVRWSKGKARSGRYTVYVNLFRSHVRHRGVPFELVAKLGPETELRKGTVGRGGHLKILRFVYIRPNVSVKRRPVLETKYRKQQADEERKASRLFDEATEKKPYDLQKLMKVAFEYPHTDIALKALQMLPGKPTK